MIRLDPRRVDRINEVMDDALLGHEHEKVAIDVACWDIFGKSTGLPVCEILGGRTDVRLPIITSLPVPDQKECELSSMSIDQRVLEGFLLRLVGNP